MEQTEQFNSDVEREARPFESQIDTLLNLADLVSKSIETAKTQKLNTEKLINARGWLLELASKLGNTEPYSYVPEKPERKLLSLTLSSEVQILNEIVDFIVQVAPTFQRDIEEHNKPIYEKIQELQKLGEKTKEDQEEEYKKMIILIYPYFQLICQNLMETKFQYQARL